MSMDPSEPNRAMKANDYGSSLAQSFNTPGLSQSATIRSPTGVSLAVASPIVLPFDTGIKVQIDLGRLG